jgi:hypothetical protein
MERPGKRPRPDGSSVTSEPVATVDETHAMHLARHLAGLYKRGRFTDLRVRCGGEVFEMHASVVTCGSEYFRGLLEHAMVGGSGAYELHEVQPRVFERAVQWLYSGDLGELSDVEEALALLEGSRFLRIRRLEAQCCAWLCAQVDAAKLVELVRSGPTPRVPTVAPTLPAPQFRQASPYVPSAQPAPSNQMELPRELPSAVALDLTVTAPSTAAHNFAPSVVPSPPRLRVSSAPATSHTPQPPALVLEEARQHTFPQSFPQSLPCCYCRYLAGAKCLYCQPAASERGQEPLPENALPTPCSLCQSFCGGQCRAGPGPLQFVPD